MRRSIQHDGLGRFDHLGIRRIQPSQPGPLALRPAELLNGLQLVLIRWVLPRKLDRDLARSQGFVKSQVGAQADTA